ncbi:hypothetical protein E3N88_13691 [Mikania micrantha]|uniref:Uncharacterized protein n=1 Tax=Mikania micrantha TaxID=192012 RepID=A0A5N6P0Z8_9ASTR|nr:hypothetical protein E3N88_13691 [Mikania micrantha]
MEASEGFRHDVGIGRRDEEVVSSFVRCVTRHVSGRNLLTFSRVHEADFEDFKNRAFDRPNEGGNTRESTGVIT